MFKSFGKKFGKYQFWLNPHNIEQIMPIKDNKDKLIIKHKITNFKNFDLNEVIFIKKI